MGYPNTSNCVKNNSLRVLFSTLFSVLDTLMKQCFSCLIYYLKLTPTLNAILEAGVSAGLSICIAFFVLSKREMFGDHCLATEHVDVVCTVFPNGMKNV